MKLSVIIPTFNRAKYLDRTLVCFHSQTISKKSFEIIIVDSGVDQDTALVVAKHQAMLGNITHKKITGSGNRSLIRQTGSKVARGKILLFIDNDILVDKNFLKEHLLAHETDKDVVFALRWLFQDFPHRFIDPNFIQKRFKDLKQIPALNDERYSALKALNFDLDKSSAPWIYCFSHNFSISKIFYFSVNGFDPKFGIHWGLEDVELGFRLFNGGAKFKVLKNLTNYHQFHPRDLKSMFRGSEVNGKYFLEKHPYSVVEIHIRKWFMSERKYDQLLKYLYSLPNDRLEELPACERIQGNKIILGCNFKQPSANNTKNKDHFLGAFLPLIKDKSKDSTIFLGHVLGKDSVLFRMVVFEGMRISEKGYFLIDPQSSFAFDEISLKKNLLAMGFKEWSFKFDFFLCVQFNQKLLKPLMISIPNNPFGREREHFISLALELKKLNYPVKVNVVDAMLENKPEWLPKIYSAEDIHQATDSIGVSGNWLHVLSGGHVNETFSDFERMLYWDRENIVVNLPAKSQLQDQAGRYFLFRNEFSYKKGAATLGLPVKYLPLGVHLNELRPSRKIKLGIFNFVVLIDENTVSQTSLEEVVKAFLRVVNKSKQTSLTIVIPLSHEVLKRQGRNENFNFHRNSKFNNQRIENSIREQVFKIIGDFNVDNYGAEKIRVVSSYFTGVALREVINEHDCLISLNAHFSSGVEVLEALCLGKQVITTKEYIPSKIKNKLNGLHVVESKLMRIADVSLVRVSVNALIFLAIEINTQSLFAEMKKVIRLKVNENEIAENRKLVSQFYTWPKIAKEFVKDIN